MSNSVATAMMAGEEGGALTMLFHPWEEGGFTAECIDLPGCFSEGETQEEAERNIRLASMLASACCSRIVCVKRPTLHSSVKTAKLTDKLYRQIFDTLWTDFGEIVPRW